MRAFKGITNITLVEASVKLITRRYLVASRLAQIFPSATPLCFRGFGLVGDHVHIWWPCPHIRKYWGNIFQVLRKLTGVPIPKSPLIALLNERVAEVSKVNQKLILFVLVGARISVAWAWKQPWISIPLTIKNISCIMAQEKAVSFLQNTSHKFEAVWGP